jgi:hypothetical protein
MKKVVISLLIALGLSACATVKIPQATGGSKADGIVELSYQYGGFEKPQVQWDKALITAQQRCKAWNYQSAEAFGGTTSQCQANNQYGCVSFFVTAKYQCTD